MQFQWKVLSFLYKFFKDWFHEYSIEKTTVAELEFAMKNEITSYTEYVKLGQQLDQINGYEIWKKENESEDYDFEQVEERLAHIRELKNYDNIHGMLWSLRSLASNRNFLSINGHKMFPCAVGTKNLIQEFIDEINSSLLYIKDYKDEKQLTLLERYKFFKEMLHAHGRTALVISGGAGLAMFSLGVIKALREQNLLPQVICGSSAGAVLASVICVRPESEVDNVFKPGYFKLDAFESMEKRKSPIRKIMRLFRSGVLMDISKLQSSLRENIGDVTFLEAFRLSGKILNITVSGTKNFTLPTLLNYITAPHVLVWSAAACSCCAPLVYKPTILYAKDPITQQVMSFHSPSVKFKDGSFWNDIPLTRLAELFNVNFHIVCQTNPHVIPFLTTKEEESQSVFNTLKRLFFSELKFRILQAFEYGIIPKRFTYLESLIAQQYTGDITIKPADFTLENLRCLLENPSDEYLQRCQLVGARRTYPKISIIQNRCRIEKTLDECVHELKKKLMSAYNVDTVSSSDVIKEIVDEFLQ